jgi:hypothetical protein
MLEERAVEDGMGAVGRPGCAVGLFRGTLRFRPFGTEPCSSLTRNVLMGSSISIATLQLVPAPGTP